MLKATHRAVALAYLVGAPSIALALPSDELKDVDCQFAANGIVPPEKHLAFTKHRDLTRYRKADANCDGILNAAEAATWRAAEEADEKYVTERARETAQLAHDRGVPLRAPAPEPPKPTPKQVGGWQTPDFILRESFDDISIYGKRREAKLAAGSSFSYTRDGDEKNSIWSAKGIAALPFAWKEGSGEFEEAVGPRLAGFAVTPAITFNRVSNSKESIASKKDVDVLTGSLGSEVALYGLLDETTLHFLRARGGLVSNFDVDARSWNAVLDYQPQTNWRSVPNISTPNTIPALNLVYNLDVIARLHYARKIDDEIDDPLFSRGDSMLRLGPSLVLSVYPFQGPPVPKWLQQLSFTAGFSWLTALNHDRSFTYFTGAVVYALDDEGNVGIKLSHDHGRLEDTGENVNLTKVGLTLRY